MNWTVWIEQKYLSVAIKKYCGVDARNLRENLHIMEVLDSSQLAQETCV